MLNRPSLADLELGRRWGVGTRREGNGTAQLDEGKCREEAASDIGVEPHQSTSAQTSACKSLSGWQSGQKGLGAQVRAYGASSSSRASVYCSIGTGWLQLDPCAGRQLGFPLLMATRAASCTGRRWGRVGEGWGKKCRWVVVGRAWAGSVEGIARTSKASPLQPLHAEQPTRAHHTTCTNMGMTVGDKMTLLCTVAAVRGAGPRVPASGTRRHQGTPRGDVHASAETQRQARPPPRLHFSTPASDDQTVAGQRCKRSHPNVQTREVRDALHPPRALPSPRPSSRSFTKPERVTASSTLLYLLPQYSHTHLDT